MAECLHFVRVGFGMRRVFLKHIPRGFEYWYRPQDHIFDSDAPWKTDTRQDQFADLHGSFRGPGEPARGTSPPPEEPDVPKRNQDNRDTMSLARKHDRLYQEIDWRVKWEESCEN